MSNLWVCSKWNTEPKNEEKWCVLSDLGTYWQVKAKISTEETWDLPKCDYRPCPAPEQWERVDELKLGNPDGRHVHFYDGKGNFIGDVEFQHSDYRVRSLVVERRK